MTEPSPVRVRVLEGVGDLEVEDSGQALILQIDGGEDLDAGWFVRVQSWDESKEHVEGSFVREWAGRRVRVTLELLDEPT